MVSIVTPTRQIDDKGEIKVTEEDNAMVLLDHGNGVISHVQSRLQLLQSARPRRQQGEPAHHLHRRLERHHGAGRLRLGAAGRRLRDRRSRPIFSATATDAEGYVWQQGASLAAECLATGKELLVTPEHALHVLEIIVRGPRVASDTAGASI